MADADDTALLLSSFIGAVDFCGGAAPDFAAAPVRARGDAIGASGGFLDACGVSHKMEKENLYFIKEIPHK